ncbi:MAG: hypothetical protein IPH89_13600 [Bacteroidetes bacterium]|nr:hypothetical protein [Bacteroidota bacterium]
MELSYVAEVVVGTDYHHIEQILLGKIPHCSKVVEVKKNGAFLPRCTTLAWINKLKKLEHHNLFFDAPFDLHAEEIYDRPQWLIALLLYLCF